MPLRRLGRTELQVSLLGLGTGTRFGDPSRSTPAELVRLVRGALDLGVNYLDTAPMYLEAESLLGRALAGVSREEYVLATKVFPMDAAGAVIRPDQLRESVETSLRRLRVASIDVLQLHGLRPSWLGPVMDQLGGELARLREAGRYRFLGVAETIVEDPWHEMLPQAVETGWFDQTLVGYNVLSPGAEVAALPSAQQIDVGVAAMVVVGPALRDPAVLAQRIRAAQARGEHGALELDPARALDVLLDEYSPDPVAAAYRYAASHPAVATVLSGTLNLTHLQANLAAVTAPPFSASQLSRHRKVFRHLDPCEWIIRHL